MKENYYHLCVVLDASGSMDQIADDIKGTFNNFMAEQKREEGKNVLDVFQFSDDVERIVDRLDMARYEGNLMDSYKCCGCTALYDAICTAIDTIGREFSEMEESERPEKVIFVIVTDGHENASREFSLKDVKERIDRQSSRYNWEFIYLAAKQEIFEAEQISRSLGVSHFSSCKTMDCLASMTSATLCKSMKRPGHRTKKKD